MAEGYDFSNLAFIVGNDAIVAIDAGTTESSAREAVAALRTVSQAPIKYVILTHGHWDHVGGLAAVREPGSTVIAEANFPGGLARSRRYHPPFHDFFGSEPNPLDVKPDRLISTPETLRVAGIELALIPGKSGETDDALYVRDLRHDILFFGDVFMPYSGAPFVAEGSAEELSDATTRCSSCTRALGPRTPTADGAVHDRGHARAAPALRALYDRSLDAAQAARRIAELLHDNFIPASLRDTPEAVLPYLIARDTFVQRLYADTLVLASERRRRGELHARRMGAPLDEIGGNSEDSFRRTADRLEQRGDAALAFRIAELGLARYPKVSLRSSRARALTTLVQSNSQLNSFRFIVYSEWRAKRSHLSRRSSRRITFPARVRRQR